MVRRSLVQPDPQKPPQRQRIRHSPSDPTLSLDAFAIPDPQRAEVNARPQRRPTQSHVIKPRTQSFHELVEPCPLQHLVQSLVKRMPRCSRQFCVCDPNLLLLPHTAPLAHRHTRILWILSVDSPTLYLYSNLDLHHGLLGDENLWTADLGPNSKTT